MNSHGDGTETPAPAAHQANTPLPAVPFFAGAWPLVVLLLLATLPYVGILRNDFTYAYDDKAQIIDNPYVHSFGHWRETLTTNVWSHKGTHGLPNYYRPMMTVGFLLCYQIFGPLAYGFHLASLLLHAAVVVMVFLLAERLLGDRGAAYGAAALFALHPAHVESVAWISAVTDLELTFFYVLTFWFFLQCGEPRGGRRLWASAAMTVSFLLAIFSKEQALTLPGLAAIYEHFYREDRAQTTWAQKLRRYGPLWLLSIIYIPVRIRFLGLFGNIVHMHQLTAYETVLSALALVGQYFGKLLWPAHLSAFYVFTASTRLWDARVGESMGALALCAAVFIVLWKRGRPASFGTWWIVVTLAPVLDARLMTAYVFTERYLYLPSVGFCLVAGWAGAALWRTAWQQKAFWRGAAVATGCVVAGLCVLRIVTRIPDWRDDLTLLTRALAVGPNQFPLRDCLGQAYWMRDESDAAERQWREALRLEPNSPQVPFELGVVYAKQRRFDEAVALFERSIRLDPTQADAHLDLGAAYAEMGKLDLAAEQFRAAIALTPLNFNAHNVLGKLYFDSGRLPEAEDQFRQSLACEPNLAAYDHLGYIYVQWGDRDRAERAFKAALAMKSTDSRAHYNLGLIYAAAGRTAQARDELQAALAADPNNPDIVSALEKLRP